MYILQNKVWYSVTGFKGLQTIAQMQMLQCQMKMLECTYKIGTATYSTYLIGVLQHLHLTLLITLIV